MHNHGEMKVLFQAKCSIQICIGDRALHQTEGDAALVGDKDNTQTRWVMACDCLGNTGQRMEFAPQGHIAIFRHLAIEDAVAVQEDGEQGARE